METISISPLFPQNVFANFFFLNTFFPLNLAIIYYCLPTLFMLVIIANLYFNNVHLILPYQSYIINIQVHYTFVLLQFNCLMTISIYYIAIIFIRIVSHFLSFLERCFNEKIDNLSMSKIFTSHFHQLDCLILS